MGWILDIYVEDEGTVTWLLDVDGSHLKLLDQYNPSFCVIPKEGHDSEVLSVLGSNVGSVFTEEKRVNLGGEKKRVININLKFQMDVILTLLSGENYEQVRTEGYAKAKEFIIEAIRRIMEDEVRPHRFEEL